MTTAHPARRGDLVAFSEKHTATFLRGGTKTYETWKLGTAAKVDAAGVVEKVALHFGSKPVRITCPANRLIIATARLTEEPAAVIAKAGDCFDSLEDLRNALRPFVKAQE